MKTVVEQLTKVVCLQDWALSGMLQDRAFVRVCSEQTPVEVSGKTPTDIRKARYWAQVPASLLLSSHLLCATQGHTMGLIVFHPGFFLPGILTMQNMFLLSRF